MSIAQTVLLPEFDHEVATTRSLLALTPESKADWKPHPKSMSLGQLAAHLAELLTWAGPTCNADFLDLAPVGGPAYVSPKFTTTADLLARFDANVAAAREAIAGLPDASMGNPWALKQAGQTLMEMPKGVVLRSFVFNHSVHHRGQFSVYLRLNDVPLPSIYGPTADSRM